MSGPSTIDSFSGEYRWLSNFYPARVHFDGDEYPTVEHAYQAAKTEDQAARRRIAAARTPGEAKRLGRQVELRDDWDAIKDYVMIGLLREKFAVTDLRAKLMQTRSATLIEGNTWGDTYWGVCRGRGLNRLGVFLMRIRDECFTAF